MRTTVRSHEDREELLPTRHSLVERLQNLEDRASWQDFFDTYWKLIYCAAIKSGLGDGEAEEVVQETVISIARKMETFEYRPVECSFKGWLMHVTRRRIIDQYRKRRVSARWQTEGMRTTDHDDETGSGNGILDVADPRADLGGIWEEEWQKNLVDAAMERVKRQVEPQHYQIFYMHAVKNMTARDIGDLLQVSSAKVYVVRHRVGKLVKQEIDRLRRREEQR